MKMRNIVFLLVFTYLSSDAQIIFQKTFGSSGIELGRCIRQTYEGGYIMTGFTYGLGAGGADVFVIKTDIHGDTLWTRTFGGANDDRAFDIIQTFDSGYIVVGSTRSFIFNSPSTEDDFYVIRLNSYGDTLWTRHIGGSVPANDIANSVIQTSEGSFIICGITNSYGSGAYLVKLNSSGDSLLWAKSYAGGGMARARQTNDGGFVVFYDDINSDTLILVKTNNAGDTLWTKEYAGIAASDIRQTVDGGFIMLTGSTKRLLIKVDALGDTTWTKEYYYNGFGNSGAWSIYQTSDMGYVTAGIMPGDNGYVTKTDSMGNIEWVKNYGAWGSAGDDHLFSISQANDGGFIMFGSTDGFGAGGFDYYMIKTDYFGNSGCNNANPGVTQSYPTVTIKRPGVMLSSGGLLGNTSTIVGSGSIVTTLCTNVGTNEIEKNDLLYLYPNPTDNELNISCKEAIINKMELFNLLGSKIFESADLTKSKSEVINVSQFPPGMYFVKCYTEKGAATLKFVKE